MLKYLLDDGNYNICSFDFAGCGNSEGEYLTLGYWEWQDIDAVVKRVFDFDFVDTDQLALWGRSMGAVSCIRYGALCANRTPIKVMCLDSPFTDLA